MSCSRAPKPSLKTARRSRCPLFIVLISLLSVACAPQAELVTMVSKTQAELNQCHDQFKEQFERERALNEQIKELNAKLKLSQEALSRARTAAIGRPEAQASADHKMMHQLSREQLAMLATSAGAEVTLRERVQVLAEFGELKSALSYSPKNHVLSGYARFTGFKVDLAFVNQWNKTRRFSRAYLDKNQSVVLESELDLEPGMSPRALHDWIKNFGIVINLFHYTLRKNRAGSTPKAPPERLRRESI